MMATGKEKIKYISVIMCLFTLLTAIAFPTLTIHGFGKSDPVFGCFSTASFHNCTPYSISTGQAVEFEPWLEDQFSENHTQSKMALNSYNNFPKNCKKNYIVPGITISDKPLSGTTFDFYLRI